MLELNANTRVAEIEAASETLMKTLQSTGIFRPGDDTDTTIGDLCFNFGLNPVILLRMLESAQEKDVPTLPEVHELDGLTLTQIVENIEHNHHDFLRRLLPDLDKRIDTVAQVHGDTDERLKELRELFAALATDLENHLLHEEDALFPMCREMEAAGSISPTRCGSAVGGPIACMETEHEQAREVLAKLRELTDNFTVPSHACNLYRSVIDDLKQFDHNMAVHMQKEDKVLFPRALEAQKNL